MEKRKGQTGSQRRELIVQKIQKLRITSNHNYLGNGIPYDDTVIEKPVYIDDFVWIGANVTVLPGVTIGEGAIIQAGIVVIKSIPPLGIAGGNPAKCFKMRDENHYYKMKSEKKFY